MSEIGRAIDRRAFLRTGLRAGLALPVAGAALGAMAACGGQEEPAAGPSGEGGAPAPEPPESGGGETGAAPSGETPGGSEGGGRKLVTEVPAMEATVETLQYTNESPKADQTCANCTFYTAGVGGMGRCQLFTQGYVKEGGWCQSWTKKT